MVTPDKKEMMAANHILAKIKLQGTKTCALHHTIGHSWFQAIEPEFKKEYFSEVCIHTYLLIKFIEIIFFNCLILQLSQFLASERSKSVIFPPEHLVWSWTHFCDIQEVKAVIIGQDPYHGQGQAHGNIFIVTDAYYLMLLTFKSKFNCIS